MASSTIDVKLSAHVSWWVWPLLWASYPFWLVTGRDPSPFIVRVCDRGLVVRVERA